MNILTRTLSGLALGLCLSCGLMAQANATTVDLTADGLWHTFDVDELSSATGGLSWIDYADGSALTFQINNSSDMLLTVVDGGFSGDVFFLIDGPVMLGPTSAATNNYPASIGLDFDAAMSNPLYSKGSFLLTAGSHSITGFLMSSAAADFGALNATVGAVMLQAVPEPAQWASLLAGMSLLAFGAGRRSRK